MMSFTPAHFLQWSKFCWHIINNGACIPAKSPVGPPAYIFTLWAGYLFNVLFTVCFTISYNNMQKHAVTGKNGQTFSNTKQAVHFYPQICLK